MYWITKTLINFVLENILAALIICLLFIIWSFGRCMEATPSLACANKCVFCWRHHTNPVGKSWKWKMDDPLDIVNAAIDQHTKMVKQMKGVPGVYVHPYEAHLWSFEEALCIILPKQKSTGRLWCHLSSLVCLWMPKSTSQYWTWSFQMPANVPCLN